MSDPSHAIPGHHPPLHGAPHPPPVRPPVGPPSVRTGVVAPQSAPPSDKELEPLTLVEDRHPTGGPTQVGPPPPKKIQAFGEGSHAHKKHDWKRQTAKTGVGACRVRSFHGKYSEQGLEYLDNAVNEWLDANPDIEVKFVTPTVGTFEGKIREAALVLNLWY